MLSRIAKSNFYTIDYDICKSTCINKNVSAKYADTIMKENQTCFCCLCDEYEKVKAVIYDSDIKRVYEQGLYETSTALEAVGNNCMIQLDDPLFDSNVDYLFYAFPHAEFPIINGKHDLIAVVRHKRPLFYPVKENPVLLMAGGLGMRLRPYTEKTPKPLLSIGGVSILERILTYFSYYGFHNFYISVHYLAEQIEKAFGDGSQFGLNIIYLHEKEWLGTAGAIALMPRQEQPCLVCNGDLLMDVDLDRFLLHHNELGASGTMCIYRYTYNVAYGVVEFLNNNYCGIVEKPEHYSYINTGLYCISPETWDYFHKIQKMDMPTLFDKMLQDHRNACVYHHSGKWIDIGTPAVFKRLIGKHQTNSNEETVHE